LKCSTNAGSKEASVAAVELRVKKHMKDTAVRRLSGCLPQEGWGPRLGLIALKGRWPPRGDPSCLRKDARMVCRRRGMCAGIRGVCDHDFK